MIRIGSWLIDAGFAKSVEEANELLDRGRVLVDGKTADRHLILPPGDYTVLVKGLPTTARVAEPSVNMLIRDWPKLAACIYRMGYQDGHLAGNQGLPYDTQEAWELARKDFL